MHNVSTAGARGHGPTSGPTPPAQATGTRTTGVGAGAGRRSIGLSVSATRIRLWDCLDLLLVIAAGLAQLWLVLAGEGGPVRSALGFLFVTFLPGYSLLSAVYRPFGEYSAVERAGMAVGASLALSTLSGLALDRLALSVRPELYAMWMSAAIALLALGGIVRRHLQARSTTGGLEHADAGRAGDAGSAGPGGGTTAVGSAPQHGWAGWRQAAVLAVLGVLVAAAMGLGLVAHSIAPAPAAESVSLYLLDPAGAARDYPHVAVGGTITVSLGISYQGQGPARFELQGPDGRRMPVSLNPGQNWTRQVRMTVAEAEAAGNTDGMAGQQHRLLNLRWELYRPGSAEALRTVQLWVRPEEDGAGN